jgi:hexokinase
MNVYDQALDQASDNNGMQHLEKMVSGMYLGEIARHVFVDMIKNGLLFDGSNLPVFSEKYMLRTEHLSLIAQGSDFFAEFGITDVKEKDKKTIREVCRIVSTRSARIAGTAIAAVITWMDASLERNHTVAIDGALFEKYPGYRDCITDMLQELFGKKAKRIRIELVRDGSGIGSAVVGAVTASS